jgi:hypothetical protein
MVSTPLVLTALFLLLILQIITIIRVERIHTQVFKKQDTNVKVSAHKSSKKEFNTIEKRKDKKQLSKPRPKEQKPPVSSVDKSLRDINLRLKNAERDQEKARRRLNENTGKGSGKKNKYSKPKRNSKNRNESSRDKRNYSREKTSSGPPATKTETSHSITSQKPLDAPPVQEKAVSVPDNGSSSASEPSFGRGNKITVKRRNLNKSTEERPEEQSVPAEENLQNTQSSATSDPLSDSPQEAKTDTEDQKISFGRR